MDTFARRKYVEARREGHGARTALDIARGWQKVREMAAAADWDDKGGAVWHDDDNACTFRVSWEYDTDDPREHGTTMDPETYPLEERVKNYRRRGMAKGPAWEMAREDHAEMVADWERGWDAIIVQVTATDDATGAEGWDTLGMVDVMPGQDPDDMAWDAVQWSDMLANAADEMAHNAHAARMRTLPPMLHRPRMDAA